MANQSARLYVGGYQGTSSTEKLEEIFKKYGPILEIKRNRNFSFVQYSDESHAQAAISNENGKSYFGKILDVQIAKQSRPPGGDRDNDRDKDGGGRGGPPNVFQAPFGGGGFDNKRDEGFRDSPPAGFRGGRPGGPPDDRFANPRYDGGFGGPGGGYGGQGGPGGFDRGPPPGGPGFNGQGGPRGGPGFGGPPPRNPPARYDDGPPGGFRDGPPGGDRYGGPPAGRGYGGGGPGPGVAGAAGGFRGGMEGPGGEHPPTQPPGPLAISHENRTNDVEIIVINKAITDYGEFIEQKLKSLAFTVDLLFPNEEVPLRRVLANIASRGTLYAILVTPHHREKRSLTLNILHGAPQEHRNMLVDDAVTLISRNYEMYAMQTAEKNRELPPEDIRSMMQQFIQGRQLSIPQLDKVLLFFTQQKAKVESMESSGQSQPPPPLMPPLSGPGQPGPLGPPNKGTSLQEAELQNRILNILNKGGGSMQPAPPMVNNPTNPGVNKPPPLLNDPSVQKALDNLIQGFNPNSRMKR